MSADSFLRICHTDVSPLENEKIFSFFYEKMPIARREKIDRFRFGKDKRLSLGAGILLWEMLKEINMLDCLGSIGCDKNGKPFISSRPDVHFNLSHSGTKVLCCFSSGEVGCDVESLDQSDLKIAERYFARSEYELIAGQPSVEKQKEMFCRLWTLKESFLKAAGTGFRLPLDAFSITIDKNGRISVLQNADDSEYSFREFDFAAGCRYACCIRGSDGSEVPEIREIDLEKLYLQELRLTEALS